VVDFNGERSLRRWYATIGKNGWRLEEFQHYYGNATFDDRVSTDAARFLLRIYLVKRDPTYKQPLERAIRFVLESQYPVGGWPQRYPLRNEFSHHGRPDYTSYITFNDDVVWENVRFLIECYIGLGEQRFLDPIRRGMEIYLLTQKAAPQAGWAQQYTLDLKPVGARTYEPEALLPDYTAAHVDILMTFYRLTGESRFLARIPEALDWLDSCRLPETMSDGGRFTHPTFVEIGTNAPLFVHRRGTNVVNGEYFVDHDDRNLLAHYGGKQTIDTSSLRVAYSSLKVISVEAATEGSPLLPGSSKPASGAPASSWPLFDAGDERSSGKPSEAEALRVIEALDQEGRWLTRYGMTSHPYRGDGKPDLGKPDPGRAASAEFARTQVGDETDTSPYRDRSGTVYLQTGLFIQNMRTLIGYLAGAAEKQRANE